MSKSTTVITDIWHLSTVTLKRIDLTGNLISEIEDGAFSKLTLLEELSLADNRLVKLPMLPAKLTSFSANNNLLKTRGVKANIFKVHIIISQQLFHLGISQPDLKDGDWGKSSHLKKKMNTTSHTDCEPWELWSAMSCWRWRRAFQILYCVLWIFSLCKYYITYNTGYYAT